VKKNPFGQRNVQVGHHAIQDADYHHFQLFPDGDKLTATRKKMIAKETQLRL